MLQSTIEVCEVILTLEGWTRVGERKENKKVNILFAYRKKNIIGKI